VHGATPIVGRDNEIAAIQDFLGVVAAHPVGLVFAGDPGIGKTALWEAAVELSREVGYRVLEHRSVQAESELAFAALIDLIAPVLDMVADQIPAPRRQALELALLLSDDIASPVDPRAIGLGVLDVLVQLARRSPVILALDDLQWLDESSASVLPIALRRLREERVGVLATHRKEPGIVQRPLSDLSDGGWVHEVRLDGLEGRFLGRILSERLSLHVTGPQLERIEAVSAGNPFYALELATAIVHAQPGVPISVPETLRDLLGSRLDRLPGATSEILLSAAAMTKPSVEVLASACGDLVGVIDALHVATRERVIVQDGEALRFAHPLLASLCYERALPSARRQAHAALADAVEDREARARHLALAAVEPDETVAAELDRAASHAADRGATVAAFELACLAVDHTPAALAGSRTARRLEAARLCRFSGDFNRAATMYKELLHELPPGLTSARARYAAASIARLGLDERVSLCEKALADCQDDPECTAQVLGFLGHCRWLLGDMQTAVHDSRRSLQIAERTGDGRLRASALARTACIETFALDLTPGLMDRALAADLTVDHPVGWHENPPLMLAVAVLHGRDDLELARSLLAEVEAVALDRGDEDTRPWAVMQLMILEWHAGRWTQALEHASAARELAARTGNPHYQMMVERFAAPVEAGLGLVQQARETAQRGARLAWSMSNERMLIGCLTSLGQVELALGDHARADYYLRDLPERLLRTGHRNPVNGPWADTIETMIGLGQLEQARELVTTFERLASRTNGWARSGAHRCIGLLACAEGDTSAACIAFQSAIAAEAGKYPFERGRALLALGAARRRAKEHRRARELLEDAVTVFTDVGAPLWAAKATTELGRIAGRRPLPHRLTDSEQRVAILAARGKHNREIAQHLFLSVGTVETYLSRVYHKLGVRSRTELALHLPATSDTSSAPPAGKPL